MSSPAYHILVQGMTKYTLNDYIAKDIVIFCSNLMFICILLDVGPSGVRVNCIM